MKTYTAEDIQKIQDELTKILEEKALLMKGELDEAKLKRIKKDEAALRFRLKYASLTDEERAAINARRRKKYADDEDWRKSESDRKKKYMTPEYNHNYYERNKERISENRKNKK